MFSMQGELLSRLQRLDEDILLLAGRKTYRLVVAGSAALVLQDALTRMTQDIDALNVSREISMLLNKYNIDTNVSAYLDHFAYDYESRLIPLELKLSCLCVFMLSLEDIVIAKLNSDRDKDYMDITSGAVLARLNWELLDKIANDEVAQSALNERRYRIFRLNYENYVREWRQKL